MISQKIGGLLALSRGGNVPQWTAVFTCEDIDVAMERVIEYCAKTQEQRYFIRLCPHSPNHGGKLGGMDSFPVWNKDLYARVRETHKALVDGGEHPYSGLIVMPYINAVTSAVINPYTGVWGKGHDGVTASKGLTVTFKAKNATQAALRKEGVEAEYVGTGSEHFLVQARQTAGHTPPNSKPYAKAWIGTGPAVTEVKSIYDMGQLSLDDLLSLKGKEGMVIVDEEGNLNSHAAAHARGIGCVYSTKAVELDTVLYSNGSWLGFEPMEGKVRSLDDDFATFLDGYRRGTDEIEAGYHRKGQWMAYFFHDWVGEGLNDPQVSSFYAGHFVAWLVNHTLSACLGEVRHVGHACKTGVKQAKPFLHLIDHITEEDDECEWSLGDDKPERDTVLYSFLRFPKSDELMRDIAYYCEQMFTRTGKWGAGYGGKKWGDSARFVREILVGIQRRNIKLIIKAANTLENHQHNGGWLFNKFGYAKKEAFDIATIDDGLSPYNQWRIAKEVFAHVQLHPRGRATYRMNLRDLFTPFFNSNANGKKGFLQQLQQI